MRELAVLALLALLLAVAALVAYTWLKSYEGDTIMFWMKAWFIPGGWHHYAVRFDSSICFFMDGVKQWCSW